MDDLLQTFSVKTTSVIFIVNVSGAEDAVLLKKRKKDNYKNKSICEITEINQLYYFIKYFLLCYNSSEDKTNIVLL